jgi:hypothetical protein
LKRHPVEPVQESRFRRVCSEKKLLNTVLQQLFEVSIVFDSIAGRKRT